MTSSQTVPLYAGYHVAPPSAPTIVFSGTGGLLGNGNYQYVITFVTPNGETTQGAASIAASPGTGTGSAAISAIPIGSAFVTARRIYRTTVAGALSTLALVTTINNNTATTFTDTLADGSLGAAVPTASTSDPVTTISGTINMGGLITQTVTPTTQAGFAACTCNGSAGLITFTGVATAAVTSVTAVITNNASTASSVYNLDINGYTGTWITNGEPMITIDSTTAGSFTMRLTNVHATNALSGNLKVYFNVTN